MDHLDFENAVQQAVDELPREIRRHIVNVAIVVEERADAETLEFAEVDDPLDLLGFYHGIPLTERTQNYGLVLPDKISIYRQSILNMCSTEEEIRACIKQTVRHELAHYFGWDDDQLEEMGAG